MLSHNGWYNVPPVCPSLFIRSLNQVHKNIREKPVREKKARSKPAEKKLWQPPRLTYDQRKESLRQKLALLAEGEEDE